MYENEYAVENSAHILGGTELCDWYNKYFNTSYTLKEGNESSSTFYKMNFSKHNGPLDVISIQYDYFLAMYATSTDLYNVNTSISRYNMNSGTSGQQARSKGCNHT